MNEKQFEKDQCLIFLYKTAAEIRAEETQGKEFKWQPEKYAKNFFRAIFRTGLQVIENKDEHKNLPCIKTASSVMEKYSTSLLELAHEFVFLQRETIEDPLAKILHPEDEL